MAVAKKTRSAWLARWKTKHNWNEGELAKLCRGWNPGDGRIPDPAEYNLALEAVRRAVRAKAIVRLDAEWEPQLADRLYGNAALFDPRSAAAWASREFPETFAYSADRWWDEGALDTREHTSLLLIIAALAEMLGPEKLDLRQAGKAAETVSATLKRLGVERSNRTIEKHLKLAHEQVSRE